MARYSADRCVDQEAAVPQEQDYLGLYAASQGWKWSAASNGIGKSTPH